MTPRDPPKSAWLTPRESGGSAAFKAAAGGMGLATASAASSIAAAAKRNGFKLGADAVPDVPPSGKANDIDIFARGLRPDVILPAPRTPDNLGDARLKHRRRTKPGEITVHWGLKDRRPPEAGNGYGSTPVKGEDVAQNFKAGQVVGIAEYMQSRGESIYKSAVEEPLGIGYKRGHVLPGFTKKTDFIGFGKSSTTDTPAKEVIFPRGIPPVTQDMKDLYRRTHGNYDPGEMSHRNYNWPKAVAGDPHFRFGASDAPLAGERGFGAREALSVDAEDDDGGYHRTRIVNKNSEDYKQVHEDALATSRNLMQSKPPVAPGHAFGRESGIDRTHAGELIRGFYSDREQLPDHDLGKCTVQGRRNKSTGDPMGVPTIRHDLVPPAVVKRSVASNVNYGDDVDAFGLIFPGKHLFRGLQPDDFHARRSKEELRSLFNGAGLKATAADFNGLFAESCSLYQDGHEAASLEVLMQMYADWTVAGCPPLAELSSGTRLPAAAMDVHA